MRLHSSSVHEYYRNQTYGYSEPMMQSLCMGSCVWGAVADKLISDGVYDHVVVATTGWPGAPLEILEKGSSFEENAYEVLRRTYEGIKSVKGGVDGVLYHQGESDNLALQGDKGDATRNDYGGRFKGLVDDLEADTGEAVKWWISRTTGCKDMGVDDVLGEIQFGIADEVEGIERGPNTDAMGFGRDRRYDECHFSSPIMVDLVAEAWVESIKNGA